jgi:hypothetical protein
MDTQVVSNKIISRLGSFKIPLLDCRGNAAIVVPICPEK